VRHMAECESCSGTKKVWWECPECNGTGLKPGTTQLCKSCKDRGGGGGALGDCGTCGGTGQRP
jgi:hypothetical protein